MRLLPAVVPLVRAKKEHKRTLLSCFGAWGARFCVLSLILSCGCSSMPPMDQQEQMIRANSIVAHRLTSPAFVHTWGKPTYHHSEYSPFFVMRDRTMVPRSRVPIGEAPAGWEAGADAGEGVFFAYPDRGWLLVFVNEELVYQEELNAEQLHALGKSWQHEDRFKTRLDQMTPP